MFNTTAVFSRNPDKKSSTLPPGRLLVSETDEIIYANTQARHFLGLLAEESLPAGQKFLPLLRQSYQFYPEMAWLGWPQRPSAAIARYLIYTPPNRSTCFLLKVEVNEQFMLNGKNISVLSIQLVESSEKTAAAYPSV